MNQIELKWIIIAHQGNRARKCILNDVICLEIQYDPLAVQQTWRHIGSTREGHQLAKQLHVMYSLFKYHIHQNQVVDVHISIQNFNFNLKETNTQTHGWWQYDRFS